MECLRRGHPEELKSRFRADGGASRRAATACSTVECARLTQGAGPAGAMAENAKGRSPPPSPPRLSSPPSPPCPPAKGVWSLSQTGAASVGPAAATPLIRSYSTTDFSNDAFTGTRELEYEEWLYRVLSGLQLLVALGVLFLGLYILVSNPALAQRLPLLHTFIVFSLVSELLLLSVLLLLLLLLRLLLGQARAEYSAAVCGLCHRTAEGFIHFFSMGFGFYVLLHLEQMQRLSSGEEGNADSQPLFEQLRLVALFVALQLLLCCIYSLQTVPTLFGICKFLCVKISDKISGVGELQFLRPDAPLAYARLDQYEFSLSQMRPPVAAAAPRPPPPQTGQPHVSIDVGSPKTQPLLAT